MAAMGLGGVGALGEYKDGCNQDLWELFIRTSTALKALGVSLAALMLAAIVGLKKVRE